MVDATTSLTDTEDKPLRYVAQSGDEAIDDLLSDKLLWLFLAVVITAELIGWDWYRFYYPHKSSPLGLTIIAAFACGILMWRFSVNFR